MSVAMGLRRHVKLGPALRITPLPAGGLGLSIVLHAAFLAAVVLAVNILHERETETYVVNLVPSVAAIGRPEGRPTPVPAPPTPAPPAPPRAAPPREVPQRPPTATRDPGPRELPPRDLPARELPARDLPPRPSTPSVPESPTPARPVTTPTPPPRPDQKELPAVASAKTPTPLPPSAAPAAPPQPSAAAATPPAPAGPAAPPAPPQPLGQPTGSPVGTDDVTTEVNFPYAWYVQAMVRKVRERWDPKALPGQQPVVTFDIAKDGSVNVNRVKIRQSSGNPAYDQVAIRAIVDSLPFPPLPAEFTARELTIHLRFRFAQDRG